MSESSHEELRSPEEDIETGERYMRSPLTDQWYLVTEWVPQGDGRALALEKEPVDRCEVPILEEEETDE